MSRYKVSFLGQTLQSLFKMSLAACGVFFFCVLCCCCGGGQRVGREKRTTSRIVLDFQKKPLHSSPPEETKNSCRPVSKCLWIVQCIASHFKMSLKEGGGPCPIIKEHPIITDPHSNRTTALNRTVLECPSFGFHRRVVS